MKSVVYSIDGVKKDYRGRRVLDLETLSVFSGEVLVLVGPSGAGKSTLLRLLNFLEAPTQGTINFLGKTYNGKSDAPLDIRRKITTVFQRPLLLNRTVVENVRYGLKLRGEKHIEARVRDALNQVGMLEIAHQHARTLSGGEAQRVALARAIALQPEVLLLDEPTANLDPYNITKIEETLIHQNKACGTTLVMVTHNIFQARRLANRVGLLLEGRLVEVNANDHFFSAPKDARTAAFVRGEMVY